MSRRVAWYQRHCFGRVRRYRLLTSLRLRIDPRILRDTSDDRVTIPRQNGAGPTARFRLRRRVAMTAAAATTACRTVSGTDNERRSLVLVSM